jgi:tRNA (guanine-N7-)-methyltransferase
MSNFQLDASRLSWPAGWAQIFGREAPLIVEICFGNGQFLAYLARRHPEANVLGMDISLPSLRRAERRVRRAGLDNVRLLNCDAQYGLWALIRPELLQAVHINFPDPWPKAAHHHRRLIQPRFLELVASRCPAGATLDIATDHDDYAAVIAETLHNTPYFESRLDGSFVTADQDRLMTKYEKTALAAGRTCRYFKWRRNELLTDQPFPIPEELAMPHIILRSPLSLPALAETFTPAPWRGATATGRFVQAYYAPAGQTLLVDTYIQEEPYPQRIAITMRSRPGQADEYIVAVHELGFPRPTAGLHQALSAFTDWLRDRYPDLMIVDHNLKV